MPCGTKDVLGGVHVRVATPGALEDRWALAGRVAQREFEAAPSLVLDGPVRPGLPTDLLAGASTVPRAERVVSVVRSSSRTTTS